MAEQNPQSTKQVHVVNKKGVSNFFSKEHWDRMASKEDAAGWRNGWRQVKAGENPTDIAATANIPAEFRKVNSNQSINTAQAKGGLVLTEDEKKLIIQKEIENAIAARKDEIEQQAAAQAEVIEIGHQKSIDALSAFLAEAFGVTFPADSQEGPVDVAIKFLSSSKEQVDRLAKELQNNYPDQITEGGAVDNLIGILADQRLKISNANDKLVDLQTKLDAKPTMEVVTDPSDVANKGGKGGGTSKAPVTPKV